jgi:hypothetical protein
VKRKIVGVFTAVAAALLLVGVAWASSDAAQDDSGPSSTQVSPTSDVSSTGPQAEDATGTGQEDRLTGTSIDDNGGSTPTTIDDNGGSTPTTIDDNGGDRDDRDDDSTGTTIDDHGGDRDDRDDD